MNGLRRKNDAMKTDVGIKKEKLKYKILKTKSEHQGAFLVFRI